MTTIFSPMVKSKYCWPCIDNKMRHNRRAEIVPSKAIKGIKKSQAYLQESVTCRPLANSYNFNLHALVSYIKLASSNNVPKESSIVHEFLIFLVPSSIARHIWPFFPPASTSKIFAYSSIFLSTKSSDEGAIYSHVKIVK